MLATVLENVQTMLEWLDRNKYDSSDSVGSDEANVTFKTCNDNKGIGVFCNRDFKKGEVIFSIPQKCIVSPFHHNDDGDINRYIESIGANDDIALLLTKELYLWKYLIDQKNDSNSFYYPYLNTLSTTSLPCPISWNDDILQYLHSTNLGNHIVDVRTKLRIKCNVLYHSLQLSDDDMKKKHSFDDILDQLTWAYSHYVSRRYPGTFSSNYIDTDVTGNENREDGMGRLGSLVPLLDLLNHDGSKQWLVLKVCDVKKALLVISNQNLKKGDEIFSNYGAQHSNEVLLYSYGFAIDGNMHDDVSVKLTAEIAGAKVSYGLFYIKSGGFEAIPIELFQTLHKLLYEQDDAEEDHEAVEEEELEIGVDECVMLKQYLQSKLPALQSCYDKCISVSSRSSSSSSGTARKNKKMKSAIASTSDSPAPSYLHAYVQYYLRGQLKLIDETISSINDTIGDSV